MMNNSLFYILKQLRRWSLEYVLFHILDIVEGMLFWSLMSCWPCDIASMLGQLESRSLRVEIAASARIYD